MRSIFIIILLLSICIGYPVYADEINGSYQIGPGIIALIAEKDTVEIGDKITLSGKIDSSLFGSSPSDVVILISAPKDSSSDTFMLASPLKNGSFRYNQIADVGGDWEFEALYTGIFSDKVTVLSVPGGENKKTALTLSGWPTFPRVGDDVTFKGRLTDGEGRGLANKKIVYQLAPGQSRCLGGCDFDETIPWKDAGWVYSDSNGDYYFSLPVIEKGSVKVETSYEGDGGFSPSSSRTLSITVYE